MTVAQSESREVAAELGKWNWGAFLLTWIWGIGNRVWVALLALVPVVGIVMMVVLGIKGNRWAWERGRWASAADFRRSQRRWVWAALVVYAAFVVLIVVLAAVGSETETTTP
jgi:hypothetical protein